MRELSEIVSELGYSDSPNYLTVEQLGGGAAYPLASRRLVKAVHLHGTYVLRESLESAPESSIPVVYAVEARSEEEAERVHKAVWNQNLVPFLIIRTPSTVRLCAGFRFDSQRRGQSRHRILEPVEDWTRALQSLADFHARRIDDGSLWHRYGSYVTSDTRVDRRLLGSLAELNRLLIKEDHLSKEVAHALIGKYIFLRYLLDRGLLSQARLESWEVHPEDVFGRRAKMRAVRRLFDKIEQWLNGSVFPLPLKGERAPRDEHLQRVTAALLGDDPESGQMHLGFGAYNFSFIPIETLSIIYQKMLHAQEGRGQKPASYYTPLPLVNFMLAEMEAIQPLRAETRVFDPACGSGAFLVQCYRRLIERHIRDSRGRVPPLEELKRILVSQVCGVDLDEGACRMAQLSLLLTLLDYVEPADLDSRPDFKLPDLYGTNILCSDYFAPDLEVARHLPEPRFDWIVGNPPWFGLKGTNTPPEHQHALDWVRSNRQLHPVSDNQVAEAFAWKVRHHLAPGGAAGLLLPAMTLFKDNPAFRSHFFQAHRIYSVANFSNLSPYLFLEAQAGAAAVFFSPGEQGDIPVFSPLLANQQVLLSAGSRGSAQDAWSIAVDQSEVQVVPAARARSGDSLPWKWAMWGSARDERLLQRLEQRHPSLRQFLDERGLEIDTMGAGADALLLKALSLFLSSDFVRYYLCLRSPQWGVRGGRPTQKALESVPTPLGMLSRRELARWQRLQVAPLKPRDSKHRPRTDAPHARLLGRLNDMCSELLGLSTEERYLVEDFVHVRSHLVRGAAPEAVRPPNRPELQSYASVLKSNLDTFLDAGLGHAHRVVIAHDSATGVVLLELVKRGSREDVCLVAPEDTDVSSTLRKAREQVSRVHDQQWIYFARNLQIHNGRQTFLMKPLQRFWWTRTQAAVDADDLIAEMLLTEGGE